MRPKVTVLMPIYNGEKYLKDAIDSILNQTFSDFEYLIIDDGSTDHTREILESYRDKRIKLIYLEENIGIAKVLNIGLQEAKGKYIARMDADDISLPNRLEYQVAFMESNLDIGVCGTWVEPFGNGNQTIWKYNVDDNKLRFDLLFYCCLAHPSVIMRTDYFIEHGLHYNQFSHAQDYDLWVRCSKYFRLANIPEVLLKYRIHQSQSGKIFAGTQYYFSKEIRKAQIEELGISANEEELEIHETLAKWHFGGGIAFTNEVEAWFVKLNDANKEARKFPDGLFTDYLAIKYFHVCNENVIQGLRLFFTFQKSPFSKSKAISTIQRVKFFVKCILKWVRKV